MLNVIMLNVIMLSVVILSVIIPNVVMLNVIMPNVVMLNFIMPNVVMLNVMLNAIMLNVVMLNVIVPKAPLRLFLRKCQIFSTKDQCCKKFTAVIYGCNNIYKLLRSLHTRLHTPVCMLHYLAVCRGIKILNIGPGTVFTTLHFLRYLQEVE
jgi:hypothetical protein